ncbi:MAG: Holliday junction resolvase RuvX, partial [Deltaproteobacteria bacterium]|nr:Holliday junction resolvase RuvX [Deltaproteobacteria bacterium]
MRILALDVGDRRIGAAVTDPLGWTAQTLGMIERRLIEQDLEEVCGFVRDYSIQRIVVGLPLRGIEGEVGTQARKVLAFCEQLRAHCLGRGVPVEVETWDESMTTKDAEALLRATGARARRRRKSIDTMAAAVLL